MAKPIPADRFQWAIEARARSQRFLLALYDYSQRKGYESPDSPQAAVFSILVGVSFSLWRAAFLADAPTRTWQEALDDAEKLVTEVLATNAISLGTEHRLQGWTAGYYLKNAKLRLLEALQRIEPVDPSAVARVQAILLMNTDPHDTWTQCCDEAEGIAVRIGCRPSPVTSPAAVLRGSGADTV